MTKEELIDKIIYYKKKIIDQLDDTILWVKVSINSISKLPGTGFVYHVPSISEDSKIRVIKDQEKNDIIFRITNEYIYYSAYALIISFMEDFFGKIMKTLLRYEPQRLKYNNQSDKNESKISINDIIDKDKDELIDNIIDNKINKLFYDSPQKQLEYMDKALGIKIDENLWNIWIEYKSRRDVIIHNNGYVNEIYLQKTKKNAKYNLRDKVSFNEDGYLEIMINFKQIIEEIVMNIENEYDLN